MPALDTDGEPRDGAHVAELTGLVPADGFPAGTRFRAPRTAAPGAHLSLFDTIEGMRHQVLATDTPPGHGTIQYLDARHRGHARVEDRIRCGKDTNGRFPSRLFAINADPRRDTDLAGIAGGEAERGRVGHVQLVRIGAAQGHLAVPAHALRVGSISHQGQRTLTYASSTPVTTVDVNGQEIRSTSPTR